MVSLTPFIQFVGALYLSITIDSILFKRFWNPDFFAMMNSSIDRYIIGNKVNISTRLRDQLEGTAKTKSNQIDTFSRMQGCMMLLYSLALLVGIGLMDDSDNFAASQCFFLFFSILGFLSFLMSRLLLKKWWAVFVTSAVVIGVSFVAFVSDIALVIGVIDAFWLKIGVIVFLLLPLACRVFYNWLYSKVYSTFIQVKIREEYSIYETAKQKLNSKDIKGIDGRYQSIIDDYYVTSGNMDKENSCVNKYVEIVEGHFKEVPSVSKLLKHFLSRRKVKVEDESHGSEYDKEETVQPLSSQSNVLDKLVKEYESLNPKISIDAFCKKYMIVSSAFRERRKELCKQGSIAIKKRIL